AATGTWVDQVYAATDAQGNNRTLLGSFPHDGTLAVGAGIQRTQPISLPQAPGAYWFVVTTNVTGTIAEGTSFNNNAAVSVASIEVAAVPLPDLVVVSVTPPPNGVLSGKSVPVSFVVANLGSAPTSVPVWQDWVILSQDPTLGQSYDGTNDQFVSSQPVVVGVNNPSYLAAGQSYQQSVDVRLPINAQGIWYVYVVADGTGSHHPFGMQQASRTNKLSMSLGFSVTLSPPPDLVVTRVQAPAQNFSGLPMQVSWTVANNGTGPTVTGAWLDAVYMSTSSTLDGYAVLLGTFAHQGALAAGGSYTNTQTVKPPVGTSGSFYFLVKTDLFGQVFENGADANNVAATAAAETVNLTPPPDLELDLITAPATALAGHSFTIEYVVTNAG